MTTYRTDEQLGAYRSESTPDGMRARVIHIPTGRVVCRFTGETAHTDAMRAAFDAYSADGPGFVQEIARAIRWDRIR